MSSNIWGPWTPASPPCNSSVQCQSWLEEANPGVATGQAICYLELKDSDDLINSFGGCACENPFALGGTTCNEQTTASMGVIACAVVSVVVSSLIILRFLPTLIGVIRYRTVWKLNAAGTSYLFAWGALIFAWMDHIASLVRTLYYSENAVRTTQVTGRVLVILLIIAVLNLVGAFVEMSYSVRLIQNIDKLRIPVIAAVVASASLTIFTFLFASGTASAAVGFGVIMVLAICGIIGPILLYVRASQRMARTEGTKEPTFCELLTAIVTDVICAQGQMKRLLGFSRSHSSLDSKNSRDSKYSRDSREDGTPKAANNSSPVLNKQASKVLVTEQRLTHVQKQEEKMISFLSRAVTMGMWLFVCLLGFLGGIAWGIGLNSKFDTNPNFRYARLADLLQSVFVVFAMNQVLWFLDIGYRRAISARLRLSKYRSESKEVMPSKEDGSKLDVLDGSRIDVTHTGNISRENSKIVSGLV